MRNPFKRKINNSTSTLSKPEDWLIDVLNNLSDSGVSVTPDNALRQATVYSCQRVLSNTLAALPFNLMMRDGEIKEKSINHPLYSLLHDLPNEEITSFNFFQAKFTDVIMTGTGFSEIFRDGRGKPGEIWPLDSMQMLVERNCNTGKLVYFYGSERREIKRENIWRITGFSDMRHGSGIIGRSPMDLFKETIGQALTGEQYISGLLKNGGISKVALQVAASLNKTQRQEVRDGWNESNSGSKNSGNVAVLHNGAEIKELSMSVADAQLMDFMGLKKKDICGIFGVPPHMVGAESDVKFSNMEQQNLFFLMHGLLPWIKNGEQSVYRDLLSKDERLNYYAKYNVNALMRADTETRGNFYKTLLNAGALWPNEIRDFEELNPLKGGNNAYMQLNMGKLDEQGNVTGGKNENKQNTEFNTEQ